MTPARVLLGSVALLSASALARPALAAPTDPVASSTDAARSEARERFARALRLFNDNDNAAALAEYQRVYEIVPSPVVLYNIGLVYAAMGRPVEAVLALDRLLGSPGSLTPEQLARATATRAAQADRVAAIGVKVNVEGATIELDNLDVAHAPLAAPLKVASGTHVVAAVLPGYVPVRKAVSVAGHAETDVALELLPMRGQLAHLVVKSGLPAAEVLVDGQVVGETPLPSSLSLAPGKHRIELRRTGYVTTGQDMVLGDGASGELSLEPEEDPVLVPLDGTITLRLRETATIITIDGRLRGAYSGPLHVPGGRHRLRVERSGFFVSERDVVVPAEGAVQVGVALDPTSDTLATFTSGVKTRQALSLGSGLGGAVLTAAGVVLLAYDSGQRSTEKRQYTMLTGELASHAGPCFFARGASPAECYGPLNAAASSYNAAVSRDALGYALLGVGVAALATGAVLFFTAESPHRYDKKAGSETLAAWRVTPAIAGAPDFGWLGLHGIF